MKRKRSSPARKRPTAASLAALSTAPQVPQRRATSVRDLSAHAPGGVAERVFHGDVGQLSRLATAEGAAAAGKDDAFDLTRLTPLDRLKNGTVLAIDRKQAGAALLS